MDTNSHLHSVVDTNHATAQLLTLSRVRNYFPLYFINIQCMFQIKILQINGLCILKILEALYKATENAFIW
jgi:hypothetical protein